jgi:hypothetical protein
MARDRSLTLERCVLVGARVRGGKDASVTVSVRMPLGAGYRRVSQLLGTLIEMSSVVDLGIVVVEQQMELS